MKRNHNVSLDSITSTRSNGGAIARKYSWMISKRSGSFLVDCESELRVRYVLILD